MCGFFDLYFLRLPRRLPCHPLVVVSVTLAIPMQREDIEVGKICSQSPVRSKAPHRKSPSRALIVGFRLVPFLHGLPQSALRRSTSFTPSRSHLETRYRDIQGMFGSQHRISVSAFRYILAFASILRWQYFRCASRIVLTFDPDSRIEKIAGLLDAPLTHRCRRLWPFRS